MQGWTVEDHHLRDLLAHAEGEYPNEACGVVLGLPGGKVRVRPMRNIQDEMHRRLPEHYPRNARMAYQWDDVERRQMEAECAAPGCRLLAVYHSHPDHGAYFSETDQAAATPLGEPTYPGAAQIVVSVLEGKAAEIKAFVWSAEAGAYVEDEEEGDG